MLQEPHTGEPDKAKTMLPVQASTHEQSLEIHCEEPPDCYVTNRKSPNFEVVTNCCWERRITAEGQQDQPAVEFVKTAQQRRARCAWMVWICVTDWTDSKAENHNKLLPRFL